MNAATDTDYHFIENLCLFLAGTRNSTFPVQQSPKCFTFHVPKCQFQALVLSGGSLETTRRLSEHTLSHRLRLDPSCRKHDTSEDAKPTRRWNENLWGLVFLLFSITVCMTMYVCMLFYDLSSREKEAEM